MPKIGLWFLLRLRAANEASPLFFLFLSGRDGLLCGNLACNLKNILKLKLPQIISVLDCGLSKSGVRLLALTNKTRTAQPFLPFESSRSTSSASTSALWQMPNAHQKFLAAAREIPQNMSPVASRPNFRTKAYLGVTPL